MKLMQRVKIAHPFLQSVSNQFHVIILSLPMQFYKWLSKAFSKPTSENEKELAVLIGLYLWSHFS